MLSGSYLANASGEARLLRALRFSGLRAQCEEPSGGSWLMARSFAARLICRRCTRASRRSFMSASAALRVSG